MAEVATLSSQQATTGVIMANPTPVLVTSISQAQGLMANRQQRLDQLDIEYASLTGSAERWLGLSQRALGDANRAASLAQAERYQENAYVVMAELERVQGELEYFTQEFERLRRATGLPPTAPPGPPPAAPTGVTTAQAARAVIAARVAAQRATAAAVAAAAKPRPRVLPSKLPFGLTPNQALAAVGIPALILIATNLAGGPS